MNVSILIPCFNAESHIERAIESALAQTIADKEVIVVDDGSTDGSLAQIHKFGSQIRYETGPNRGGNAARNRLLELATGEWVQYLDADDYLLPGKIEQQLAQSPEQFECDALFGPVSIERTHADGRVAVEEFQIDPIDDLWQLLVRWQLPQTSGFLWRRSALNDLGGWNESQTVCQEHELYLRALTAGKKLVRTSGTGAVYRIWSEATVCRKDPLRTFRAKMAIVDRIAHELTRRNELNDNRRRCIAYARLECARVVAPLDWQFATALTADAERIAPGYCPPANATFPKAWRFVFRSFGFGAAETMASWKRKLFSAH